MAIFSQKDLDNLAIPIGEDNLEKHSDVIEIFGKQSKADVPLIKYVALLYDQKSPMRLKIPDINERKRECASIAGLPKNSEEIFNLNDDKVLVYINAYLRHQSSKVWAILSANEEVLWQYQQELLTPIKDFRSDKDKLQALEIKTKLMQECDAIIKRIEAYEDKLFGDNKDKKSEILKMSPESIANI
jgi:hypothetical protein